MEYLYMYLGYFSAIVIISTVPVLSSSLPQWQSILLMLTLLKGSCFLNSLSDCYLLVYTDKTVIIYFYQFRQLDSCLYFLIYLLCLTPSLSHFLQRTFFFLNIKLFLGMQGLCCCMQGLSSCSEQRFCSLSSCCAMVLIAMLSLVAELGLWSVQASIVVWGLSCPWACGIF